MSEDSPHGDCGTLFWTAGQRIDPTTESRFVWRLEDRGTVYEMNYTNWIPGQPDYWGAAESCVDLVCRRSYRWNDDHCSNPSCYICELDLI